MATISYSINGKADLSPLDQVKGRINEVGNTFNQVGNVIKGFIGLQIFKKLGAEIKEGVSAFSEAQAQSAKMLQAITNNTNLTTGAFSRLKNLSNDLKKSVGIDDDEINKQLTYLSGLNLTEQQIKNVMKASLDLSASGMLPLDSAVKSLAKQLTGVPGEIGKVLPAIKNLTTEQLKAGEGIAIVAKQFNGMAAVAANTLAGQTTIMKNTMDDIKKSFGAVFGAVEVKIFDLIRPELEKITSWLDEHLPDIISFIQNLPQISSIAFGAIKQIIEKAFTFDTIVAVAGTMFSNILRLGISCFNLLVSAVKTIGSFIWEPLKFGFEMIIYFISSAFTNLVNFFIKGIEDIVNGIISGINSAIGAINSILPEGAKLGELQKISLNKVADPTKPTFNKQAIDDNLKGLLDSFKNVITTVVDNGKATGQVLKDQFGPIVDNATAQIGQIVKDGRQAAEDFVSGAEAVSTAAVTITESNEEAKSTFKSIWSQIKDFNIKDSLQSSIGSIKDYFTNKKDEKGNDKETGFTTTLFENLGSLGNIIKTIVSGGGPLAIIIFALSNVLQGFMSVVQPILDNLLKPIIKILQTIGVFLANMLIPILSILGPVVEAVSKVFVWFYNKIMLPIGNMLIMVFNIVYNGIVTVINGIINAYNFLLGWLLGDLETYSLRSLTQNTMSEINTDDYSTSSTNNSSTNSSSASYNSVRDINVYVEVQGSVITMRELVSEVQKDLKLAMEFNN